MSEAISSKIKSRDETVRLVEKLKSGGKKVGFTSGVFDLLHPGHVQYLADAKELCDVLIVALNSDSSVRKNKGEERPICEEEARALTLAGLASVDYIFIFDEQNNNLNVELLKPDLYIKAGDYSPEKMTSTPIVEKHGGKAEVVSFKGSYSSSAIVERILDLYCAKDTVFEKSPPPEARPAVFLDRDGTINESVQYLHEPEKFKFIPKALDGIKKLQDAGYRIIIVTNQAGIGMGYFSKEDFFRVNKELLKGASAAGIMIDKIYFAPHSKSEGSSFRKPETGMIDRAVKELNVDLERSFVIGDMTSDIMLGKNAGCGTILLRTGAAGGDGIYEVEADLTADDMMEASDYIISQSQDAKSSIRYSSQMEKVSVSEALEMIGRASGKMGHDFNNIIGSIRGCLDLIEHKIIKAFPEKNPLERQIALIRKALRKSLMLTDKMRSYARPGKLAVAPLETKHIVSTALEKLESEVGEEFKVDLSIQESLWFSGNEFLIVHALKELFENSLEAYGRKEEKSFKIAVSRLSLDDDNEFALPSGSYASLSLTNTGKDLSVKKKGKIFEPFFSTKPAGIGKGLGLSLSMVGEIIHKHEGAMVFRPVEGGGTEVQICLREISKPEPEEE